MGKEEAMIELQKQNRYLQAMLAYQIRGKGSSPELILAEFGFGPQEIGAIVGKKPDAVRMYLKRQKNL